MMKNSLKSKLLEKFVIFVVFISFISCTQSMKDPDVLRVRLASEPASLDPTLAEDGASLMILNNTMEGLYGYDQEGHLEKRLADQVEVSHQGLEYRFWIKKGALWSDGQPILPQHFVLALERARDSRNLSKLGVFLQVISSVSADQEVLKIKLKEKTPYFLKLLTLPASFPLREDVLAAHQGKWPEVAPVTGPYRVVSHEWDQRIQLERNPLYSGKKGEVRKVDFLIVNDESTAIHLFESGQLDVIYRIQSLELSRLKKKGWIHSDPFLSTYYLAFNCKKSPFNHPAWRQAVSGAIQRKEIATLLGTGDLPAWSWIPHGLEGFEPYRDPKSVFTKSIAQVKRPSSSPLEVDAGFDHQSKNFRIMEKVQSDLKSTLGLNLKLNHMDWKSYLKVLQTDAPAIFRFGFQAPFLDPIVHLRVFTTSNLYNFTGCSSQRYDELVSQIERLESGQIRESKIHEAQKILLEQEAMLVPLYHYVSHSVVSPRIHGFRLNPMGMLFVKHLGIEQINR
jgi:oligopeptide transport system substrate-binding protein